LTSSEQTAIVAQIAKWMLELFQHHRLPKLGSLTRHDDSEPVIGPIIGRPFIADGRAKLPLDRGPFSAARSYYLACAQRENDASRALFVQDSSLPSYQRNLEEVQLQVQRCVGLFYDLVTHCPGLDDDDPEMAPFSLDIHDIGLKNILVSSEDHSKITSIVDWQFVQTRPLWCCARLPHWLRSSFSDSSDATRLSSIFRAEVIRLDGLNSNFLQALETEDTRHTLDDLADYDAFRDGFLLLPALENIMATLPGREDIPGLTAILDPSTLTGRVARINLITRGSNSMRLAMSRPSSPSPPTTKTTTDQKLRDAENEEQQQPS